MTNSGKVIEQSIKQEKIQIQDEALKIIKGNLEAIQKKAFLFLNTIITNDNIRNHQLNIAKTNFSLLTKNMAYFLNQNFNNERFLFNQALTFQYYVNEFLGRKMYFIWQDNKTGELIIFDEITTKELYNKTSKKYTSKQLAQKKNLSAVGQLTGSNVRSVQKATQRKNNNEFNEILEDTLSQKIIESNKEKIKVFLEAKKRTQQLKKRGPYFYFKYYWIDYLKNSWSFSQSFANYGRLSQAYLSAVIEDNEQFNIEDNENNDPNPKLEKALEILNGLINLDKIPAIQKGDVSITLDQNAAVHFSIKAGNKFETGSLMPYIWTAINILYAETADSLIDTLDKTILKDETVKLQQKLENTLQDVIQKFKNKYLLTS